MLLCLSVYQTTLEKNSIRHPKNLLLLKLGVGILSSSIRENDAENVKIKKKAQKEIQHVMYQLSVSFNRNQMPCNMNTNQFLCNLVLSSFCSVKMKSAAVRFGMGY